MSEALHYLLCSNPIKSQGDLDMGINFTGLSNTKMGGKALSILNVE